MDSANIENDTAIIMTHSCISPSESLLIKIGEVPGITLSLFDFIVFTKSHLEETSQDQLYPARKCLTIPSAISANPIVYNPTKITRLRSYNAYTRNISRPIREPIRN